LGEIDKVGLQGKWPATRGVTTYDGSGARRTHEQKNAKKVLTV